jgi:hypothetical protein
MFLYNGRKSAYLKLFLILFVCTILITWWSSQDILLAEDNKVPHIEIVGDSIYLDGKKFFIKGVGYSPYRPGEWPGSPVSLEIVEADFRRIKKAGFNTLRVWDTMPEEQLKLAEKYELMVIQAAGLKPDANFSYSGFLRLAESKVRQMCKISKNHPNVIMYLLMNEPHAQAVVKSGVENTLRFYRRLIEIIKIEDPNRPVSMANAYWTMWLNQSIWDVVSFNTYSYSPCVTDIGYANFIKNLKSLHSKGKPFIVTEFGLSVSPTESGARRYGGNTEEEQAEALVNYFRGLIAGGAAGGCVFEWNDEWWKAGNADIHDNHAEEWFGIIGIEDKDNPYGTLRKAYYSIKSELRLIVTKPSEGYRMLDNTEIEVNVYPVITNVQYRIDDREWTHLSKQDDWWRGELDAAHIESGLHALTIKGMDRSEEIIRRINIIKCKDAKEISAPIDITLTTDKSSYENGDIMRLNVILRDREGAPLENHYVKLGIFNSINSYNRNWEGRTNDKGNFSGIIPVIGRLEEWYYVYWANVEIEDYGYKRQESAIGHTKAGIGKGFPIRWLVAKEAEDIKIDGVIEGDWLKTSMIEIDADTNFLEGNIDSSDDLSAEVRVLWDKGNIYLLAYVRDDFPMKNKYEKSDIWKGDCIELFISVDPTEIPETGYSNSDFQILIGTNGRMWIPGQRTGGVRNDVPVLSRAVTKRHNAGYVLEAKINVANFWDRPFRVFKRSDILGFDVAIGDADTSGFRESKLIWNGTEDGYKDSAIWGRLRLE